MGARQRAQKRGKGTPKAAKGSLKGSTVSQKKGNSSISVSNLDPAFRGNALQGWQNFAHSSSPDHRNPFSMSQQARNTERHVFGWGTTKLRDSVITFVSAGHLHQDEWQKSPREETELVNEEGEDKTPAEEGPTDLLNQPTSTATDAATDGQVQGSLSQPPEIAIPTPSLEASHQTAAFKTMRGRSASSSSSDSEQIVFTGRSNSRMPSQKPSRDISKSPLRTAVPVPANVPLATSSNNLVEASRPISIRKQPIAAVATFDASSGDRRNANGRRDKRGRRRPRYISDEEEAIIQDYIANMDVDDSSEEDDHMTSKPVRKNETFRFYDGAGEENAKVQLKPLAGKQPKKVEDVQHLDQAMDWNSDDLEIFDDVSTSEEEVDEVEQVLRQRERDSGVQYLITAKGNTIGDAKWILQSRLTSESAVEEIRIFNEIQAMELEEDTFDDDEATSDSEDEEALHDLVDNIESEDDENANILAHTLKMSDEQIARALAKQEEFGMGADELLLFDGAIDGDDNELNDLDAFGQGDDFISFSTKKHTSNRTRSKRNKKQRDVFPDATMFADVLDEDPYNGFDIMDFDRPSLRPRKKGRKSGFPYDVDLEDEELKDQLVSTWQKDREKKAQRKFEREEARMAAAFDASERSEPAVIKAEIRRFLCQEIEVLRLAPMDPSTRASVHRLAKALRLNSRSEGTDGKGGGRYPVLSKTIRTPSYTIDSIWEVDALLNTRKFFPKNSASYKSSKIVRGSVTRVRRNGGVQGATYMNGEIVGASAPELGADNKGRAMLEKMGWISGMGIGAEGNKGSLEAIKHVVKTTKAGLG